MTRATNHRAAQLRFCLGLVGLFSILTALWLAVLAVVPAVALGWEAVTVTSGSMEPSIARGDVIVTQPQHGSALKPRSVVVFRDASRRGLVTHRVVGRSRDGTYVTTGDANRIVDSTPLHPRQVVGVGRLLVPLAGLPVLWSRAGDWPKLVVLAICLGSVMWLARFALLERYDPWPPEPSAPPPGPTSPRRGRLAVVLLLVLATVAAAVPLAAQARFAGTTANVTNAWAAAASFAGLRVASGTYDGDATDNRAITGVGFQPDVVFVKCTCGVSAVVRTSTMAGDATKEMGSVSTLQPDHVQSLDADGFTVGTSTRVNGGSTRTYYWVAMRAGAELKVGSYQGNGTDDRSISGVGFQPTWVITLGDGDDSIMRPGTLTGDASYPMDGISKFADRIQALQPDGFQVGSNAAANEVGTTFHYVAWKAGPDVKQTTYVGNGVDNTSINGVGFQPLLVWIKRDTVNQATWRPAAAVGDLSLFWAGTVSNSDRIQALQADGFEIGSNDQVNNLNASFHYLALKDG